jgi:hypothetical protein
MGCGSCTSQGCAPAGCKSNGGCSTGGCNKMNTYDWLQDMEDPSFFPSFNIVEVRFKGGRKEFFKNTLFERDSKRSHAVGEEKIPSEKHFYAIMFPDSLNIYTSNNKVRIKKSFKN